jgi:hypothetical protein
MVVGLRFTSPRASPTPPAPSFDDGPELRRPGLRPEADLQQSVENRPGREMLEAK